MLIKAYVSIDVDRNVTLHSACNKSTDLMVSSIVAWERTHGGGRTALVLVAGTLIGSKYYFIPRMQINGRMFQHFGHAYVTNISLYMFQMDSYIN